MRSFHAYGRLAMYLAAAALVIVGCSDNAPMGALNAVESSHRGAAALLGGVATLEQQAAAVGVPPECYRRGRIANLNGGAVAQELLGFSIPKRCMKIQKMSEAGGGRLASAFDGEWNADVSASCLPSDAIQIARAANSYAEITIAFGSLDQPFIFVPAIANNSLDSGSYSIAISGDKAVVRVLLSDKLPLDQFVIETGVSSLLSEPKLCQIIVPAAPKVVPIVVAPPPVIPDPVVEPIPAPDSESHEPVAPVVVAEPPAPEGEAEGPAPVVAEQPAPQNNPAPVVAEQPAPPAPPEVAVLPPQEIEILPATEPIIVSVPEVPAAPQPDVAPAPEGAAAPAGGQLPPLEFNQPAPVVAGSDTLPGVVLQKPAPPAPDGNELPIVWSPPVVVPPVEPRVAPPPPFWPVSEPEQPSRGPAATVPEVEEDADESSQVDGSVVAGNEPAPAGELANSNLGVDCESISMKPGAEGWLEFRLNRGLKRKELAKVRAVFRVFDAPEDFFFERMMSTHVRSLKFRLRAPEAIGHRHRVAFKVEIGGAEASCYASLEPGYVEDGKPRLVEGSYCGQASVGAYMAQNDEKKGGAFAEVFFPVKMNGSSDSSQYALKSGAINFEKDVRVSFSGPLSHRVLIAKRPAKGKGSAKIRVNYSYYLGSALKVDGCDIIVAEDENFVAEAPPRFMGAKGLVGLVYQLKPNTQRLYTESQLAKEKPFTRIGMSMLDVGDRAFDAGFPGVASGNKDPKGIYEWFQIAYGRIDPSDTRHARLKLFVPKSGKYRFQTRSDDGVRVIIDGIVVIDHDGLHAPSSRESGEIYLEAGYHDLAVRYFQGPKYKIALRLLWKGVDIADGDYDLADAYKLVPSKAFFTEPEEVAVTAN